jgi:hypothetical protein
MTTVIRLAPNRGAARVVRGAEPMPSAPCIDRIRFARLVRRLPARARRRVLGVGVSVLAVVVVGAFGTAVLAQGPPPTPRQQYDEAEARVRSAQARVDQLLSERSGLDSEEARLTGEQRVIADRLEAARREAQQFVVEAYISGSGPAVEEAIVYRESTTDVAYKAYFVKDRAARVRGAVEEQRAAFTEVDARLADFAIRRSNTGSALDQANRDLDRAKEDLRQADARLREAEAAARAATSSSTRAATTTRRPTTGGGTGANASSPGWAKLRQCESSGNYSATNGIYRGAYQFDQRTWNSVGGSGDPAAASPAEQDYRAQILYNQRGAQPWPVCGRHLAGDPGARVTPVPP